MSYSNRTLKLLTLHSQGTCALPTCENQLFGEERCVGEILHIRQRLETEPRYDALLTERERFSYPNLLLLCRLCRKRVDADTASFSVDQLLAIKAQQPSFSEAEATVEALEQLKLLQKKYGRESKEHQAALQVSRLKGQVERQKYSHKMIGSDPLKVRYIDELLATAADYWKSTPKMSPGRIGNKIKMKFKLAPKRTRYHLDLKHFEALVSYIQDELLLLSPVGKHRVKQGGKLCETFAEFQQKHSAQPQ